MTAGGPPGGGPVRQVHLDFDGTLAYMDPSHLALYTDAAAAVGLAVTEAEVGGALGAGWQPWSTPAGVDHHAHSDSPAAFRAIREQLHADRLAAALRQAGRPAPAAAVAAAARRVSEREEDPAPYHLYPDVLPLLDALEARGVAAVIVSNHVWTLPAIAAALGIGARVRAVVTSARVGYRKPHPEIYRRALAVVGGPPGEVLFVGDSPEPDVHGPRAQGMRAVLLDRAGRAADPQAIRTLAAIPDLIDDAVPDGTVRDDAVPADGTGRDAP